MTTEDFISELFYRIEEAMTDIAKHPLANLWPSEIVTVGILFALKGVGNRAFYRWMSRDGKRGRCKVMQVRGEEELVVRQRLQTPPGRRERGSGHG